MKLVTFFILSLFLTNSFSEGNPPMPNSDINNPITDQLIEQLARKKIYFGHQSVGNNIMLGITEILSDAQKKSFRIVKSLDADQYQGPMFAHSRVGYNMDPESKIIGFNNYMASLQQWQPDIAMFKFCYIDIRADADVNTLFQEYKSRMQQLKEKYPEVNFVHFTVPLTIVQTGIRADIKKIIGKPIGGFADNIKRNEYNTLLRQAYSGKEPVFDLAEIESSREDGSRVKFEYEHKYYYALAPEYGRDGRHLNALGRKLVAEKLLRSLINIKS